ncbi:hypothetical protein R3P38DRAFT_2455723, partial [Favolaschia claudopus]
MHRCWEIAELVHLIFDELDPYLPGIYHVDGPLRTNAMALSRLAQTCRRFSDPALDVLWKANEGLILLLQCLPAHSWEIRDWRFMIASPLAFEDWERCLAHSKRVRTFSTHNGTIILDNSALESIISLPPGTVFPNVTGLSCCSSSTLFSYLPFLIGPRVQTGAILMDGPAFRSSALQSFASRFRFLQYVNIVVGPMERPLYSNSISSFITQMASPRMLDVHGLNHQAYRHITSFSNLVNLIISDIIEMPFPNPGRPSPETAFPALRELKIMVSNTLFAINFLSVLHDAPLTSLSISTTQNSTPTNAFVLLSAICIACAIPQLTSLHVFLCECNDPMYEDTRLYTLPFDFIRPLLAYPNMRSLSLACPVGFELHDILVETMARAWPLLETLSLVGDLSEVAIPRSRPTLTSLATLSQLCPELQSVWLAVDAMSV